MCEKHFASVVASGLVSDVLVGDQGPSCQTIDQLPDTKVIHVQFAESVDVEIDPGEGPSEFGTKTSKEQCVLLCWFTVEISAYVLPQRCT